MRAHKNALVAFRLIGKGDFSLHHEHERKDDEHHQRGQ
jgi:hypothetical protein